MASSVAIQMMRKKNKPVDPDLSSDDSSSIGHPLKDPQHDSIDRQTAFESVQSGLQSLVKDNMPGADQLLKQFEKNWAGWQGNKAGSQPMEPTTKMSHKSSPVSKSGMDEQDEDMAGEDVDLSKE